MISHSDNNCRIRGKVNGLVEGERAILAQISQLTHSLSTSHTIHCLYSSILTKRRKGREIETEREKENLCQINSKSCCKTGSSRAHAFLAHRHKFCELMHFAKSINYSEPTVSNINVISIGLARTAVGK